MDPEKAAPEPAAPLESVDVTRELAERPARPPDFAAENRALVAIAERMASGSKDVLETLAQLALELCRADSSGVSIAEEEEGEPVFRWHAVAGAFAPLVGNALPYAASPCAVVVARREPVLFSRPERHFTVLRGAHPPVIEALLVPLVVAGEARGTLWLVAHRETRRFDGEDVRVLQSLARFAALAQQTLSLRGAESALEASERRFEKFMEHLPGLAWIKDLGGRYVFVNDAAQQAFQHSRAELLGRTDAEIFPPEVATQFAENDRRALAHGSGVETIETLEHGDGVHHSVVAKFPIPGADGAPALIGGVAIDVTARLQAEEVLRESEQRFREMAANSPAIIYTTQGDGYCTFLSSAWTQMTGLEVEQGLGFGWANAVHPDDLERTRAVFAPRPVPTPFRVEFRLAHAGGGHRWVIGSGAPRSSPSGEFLGFVGSVLDIDKEKRSEEALRASVQLYRAIGESIDYGVWVCDPNGRNVYASQSFLKLVGLTQEECSNFGWASVLHPDDAERTAALWQECVRSGADHWDMEHRFRGVDGEWHPILARGVPVKSERGETIAWAGINLDIGKQKRVEQELREVDRRKDEFLATLAHELRNPLAPIRNSLHVLRIGGDGPDTERLHAMIERQVTHLIRLVDDLLEVARMTSGKIDLRRERIELAEVMRTAVETSRPAIEAAGHRLELALPRESLVLEADAVRLAQVVSNLLNNAAKYTEGSGAIWLKAERQGHWVSLSVRDTGVGIPPAMLSRIFDLFTQVDGSLGRAQGGLGIGLALVKRLVELHGGKVEAKSAGRGAGSEFTIRLPLASPLSVPAETAPAPRESLPVARRRRVLIVDDNRDAADSLAILLRLQGVDVQVAYDGASALAAARSAPPELVLLDLAMPGMDGFEVAAALREDPALRDTRLVALTGWGQPDHRKETAAAGFAQHLVKPVRLAELRSLLELPAGSQ